MKRIIAILFFFVTIIVFSASFNGCKKRDFFRGTPLAFSIPQGFPQPVYSFQNNPVTEEGFELGRRLFYEPKLSKDGNYPCASCHEPRAAFTTFEHDRSHGYNSAHTLRNAPGLANLAWYTEYFQDGATKSLESISLGHITSPVEMGETMSGVVNKLKTDTAYKRLFRGAFGDERITDQRILNALSQFLVNMVSANAKYDRVKRGEASFTVGEQNGYILFQSKCANCHIEPLFTDFSYRNIGLPVIPFLLDYGRLRVTSKSADSLKFRVPSLRNVVLTSNYGHDGRFGTLKQVLNHYRTGIVPSATLDPLLTNGISLTEAEADDIILFLKTLSDSSYLTNPRFVQ